MPERVLGEVYDKAFDVDETSRPGFSVIVEALTTVVNSKSMATVDGLHVNPQGSSVKRVSMHVTLGLDADMM